MSVFDPAPARRDGLRTDLYQLTMGAALLAHGRDDVATFELYTRRLHPQRGYWLACGLELALEYLEGLHVSKEQLDWLRDLPHFASVDAKLLDRLGQLRFTGDVWALPEGTPVFPNEPLLRVTAPIVEAQVVETYLLSLVNFSTLIASKAARVATACGTKQFVDFGTRRAHGPEAGELVARASYVGGAAGTSNVEAAHRLGIKVHGTFAHAWVMAWDDEATAFRKYAEVFPNATTLLIDTYDTVAAARRIVAEKLPCRAVRLDSGDLGALAKQVRAVLDAGGRREVQIIASGDLEERKIAELEASGAPIDVYGVGTELATSKDCPALGGVYKVVETRAGGRVRHPVKVSTDKGSWPGVKQVWRRTTTASDLARGDVVELASEQAPSADHAPLLEQVMKGGRRLRPAPSLDALRAQAQARLAALPDGVRRLEAPDPWTVTIGPRLQALAEASRADARARIGK